MINQSVYGWVRAMSVANSEQLFGPVRIVALFELSLCFAYSHTITNHQLWLTPTVTTVQTLPHNLLITIVHIRRRHA